ncbi:PDR/VanB family oxidoreductase [Microbacterium sp. NPDC089189]|uniref:PDR/VanB family oxidoreductase n=1 Tax=Microbacterium sp. NPDC089189 TaxID=3154972 RepID=UPI0034312E18
MLTLQVASRVDEADGIAGLVLVDPQGQSLPEWTPGAHIDVHIDRPGEGALVRQYSLCGDPADRSAYRIAVLREDAGGGGSRHLHERVRPGQLVRVSEPRSLFPFAVRERMVFVAGGIGITPILPMVAAAEAAGIDWTLHYAGREPGAMAFGAHLAAFGDRVRVYVSAQGQRMALPQIIGDAAGAAVFACGPSRLLDELETVCTDAGVDLVVERFANDNVLTSESDHAFEVELSLTGGTLTVQPGESILDKVVAAGIPAPSSCRGGTCGTCETFVVEGEPDHRDAVLNAKEREESEVMMICVSRCKGARLVLEL